MSMYPVSIRRLILLSSCLFALLMLTACPGPKYPNCDNDSQCSIEQDGHTTKGVCVFGKCQECAEDSDCSDHKTCQNNRCVMACSADADCGSSMHCSNGQCEANCMDSSACANGEVCSMGRCVSMSATADYVSCTQSTNTVYFDTNLFNITAQSKAALDNDAMCLRNNPTVNVTVEGHCDDRGTEDYNMALGERRAQAVVDYLVSQGVAQSRMKLISYGEEKPAVTGTGEAVWSKNRRSVVVPQ